jgi:large subunit ribosomal protein L19
MEVWNIYQKSFYRAKHADISVGDRIKVCFSFEFSRGSTLKKKAEKRLQMYTGILISRHPATSMVDNSRVRRSYDYPDATYTLRRVSQGVGVEKTFSMNSSSFEGVDKLQHAKCRRAKIYYVRNQNTKSSRLRVSSVIIKHST